MSQTSNLNLIPVIVQNRTSHQVMMLAYANAEAIELTRSTGLAHFYSRSRDRIWKKGETSGHIVNVAEILSDCDNDALIYLSDTPHPVCHRNTPSCFGDGSQWSIDPLSWLATIVQGRIAENSDAPSYTRSLFNGDPARLTQKLGEESIEVVIAAMKSNQAELVGEVCDLLYHLTVLMARHNISLDLVMDELMRRHQLRPDTGDAS